MVDILVLMALSEAGSGLSWSLMDLHDDAVLSFIEMLGKQPQMLSFFGGVQRKFFSITAVRENISRSIVKMEILPWAPQQRVEAGKLLAHLQHMHENRLAAHKLGVAQASAQASKLLREIEHIKRQ